ncbi:MAG: hypothetical protein BGO31_18415 [Bacteroidetes bacterium 43-16]|nr:MAG: hypothetical protein BGO31_18415 [Bacteroidetes bacterium 43-16]
MKSSLIYLAKVFFTVIIITPVYHWLFDGILFNDPFSLSRFYSMGMLEEFNRWTLLLIPVFLIIGCTEYFLNKNSIPVRERNYTLSMIAVVSIAIISYLWGMDFDAPSAWSVLLPFNYTIICLLAIWLSKRR